MVCWQEPPYPKVRLLKCTSSQTETADSGTGEKNESKGGQGCQISDKVDTKKELAKVAGVSHDTIHKVEKIEAEATDRTKQLVREGEGKRNRTKKDLSEI